MKVLSDIFSRPDPHITELKGKFHRLSHTAGLMELSFRLSDEQRNKFDEQSAQLRREMDEAVESAGADRDAKVLDAKRVAENAIYNARLTYERKVFDLFHEYGRIPSLETIAIAETPVDRVVRMPDQHDAPAEGQA